MRIAARRYRDPAQLAGLEGFERACCLEDLGWDQAAADAYRTLLAGDPHHVGALTNLGTMLHERGDLRGARRLFATAAGVEPLSALAHANLAKTLAELGAADLALQHYGHALAIAPDDFAANHGIALVYETLGDRPRAERHFAAAFREGAWWTLPYAGSAPPLRVLLLVSGRGGDVVAHPFLDDRTVETTMLVPDGVPPGTALPPYDVAFNGIGDADRCGPSLERARALFAGDAGAINDPARVLDTGRARIAERMRGIAGVVAPRTVRVPRAEIDAERLAANGWNAPFLLRSLGRHAGREFVRVDDARELPAALASVPGDEVLLIAYADTCDADGCYRKYRVLFVDGRMYPVHVAIARTWKVHYFSADMAGDAAHRAEDARFLADPRAVLGSDAVAALEAVGRTLGLDYGGVDFGRDADGRIVVFEANATMAVAPPEPDPRWDYRHAAYEAVVAAVRRMIEDRARVRAKTGG